MEDRYVIIRGTNSGAFAGLLESRTGSEVVLRQSRRLWYWDGAASLSELAQRGTSKPKTCKFPAPVARHEILDAIEVIDVTPEARASIESVNPWTQ
jgi:hypothetical protein